VPEVRLHLASEVHDLWLKTEDELQEIGLPPPFWPCLGGGQGLARLCWTIGNRRRQTVSTLQAARAWAIAARLAGAESVVAADIDPWRKRRSA